MKAKYLIILIAVAFFLTLCVSVSGWSPLVIASIAADAIALGYAIGLKLKLIRAGEHFEKEGSEFGAGIVICLAKFSEHLSNNMEREILVYDNWVKKGCKGPLPPECRSIHIGYEVRNSHERAISSHIEMWMNAASDHFYELDLDRAPESLKELAELTLSIGHGFVHDRLWDVSTVHRIRELWKYSCIELDKRLKTKPDWGEW